MYLKRLEIMGFKSFAKNSILEFSSPVSAIVGPNGSGKSNIAEAVSFVLGEQSLKSLRGKRGEDLIFNGTKLLSRQNRAKVTIVFDNSKRVFDLDYDEVSISREVHRDSSNQYFINGSQVRLKDVIELLAEVHVGSSGHNIISQGEADRILGASLKERKGMVEDALGLKIHQLKIGESEKRLVKTEDNIAQVGLLRKELMPHIRFLKTQVKKIEHAQEMREELAELYNEYLKREDIYIGLEKATIKQESKEPEHELTGLKEKLVGAEQTLSELSQGDEGAKKAKELEGFEKKLQEVREKKNTLSRELGRIEGVIEYEQEKSQGENNTDDISTVDDSATVSAQEVVSFIQGIDATLHEAEHTNDFAHAKKLIGVVKGELWDFSQKLHTDEKSDSSDGNTKETEENSIITKLIEKSADIKEELVRVANEEVLFTENLKDVRNEQEQHKDISHDSERSLFELRARQRELISQLGMLTLRKEQLTRIEIRFKEEITEGNTLIGRAVFSYEQHHIEQEDVLREERTVQEGRHRIIEKIKIRLEDIGGGADTDVMKEYEETVERDDFLEREIVDLEASAESLHSLISDLQSKLNEEFRIGIKKINTQFQEFFVRMFGGGTAKLEVVQKQKSAPSAQDAENIAGILQGEEEVVQEGIDIFVNLPRKNIKGLQMLSGGERALTSIALLFAISQVNPPPFLVLDETDAALDEANSRKYGDMLTDLSEYSQLIVITHNRETMSRAGILYGVTMGADAASRLLSIKFSEAQEYAK